MNSQAYFHTGEEKLNCAQSILRGFQKEFNVPDSRIAEFKAWGGGRAPEGVCGALYAADILLKEKGKASVKEQFKAKVGATDCLAIKQEKKITCPDCVRITDELLEKVIKK
ncbi:MAG: C-GCAxxG-C-C family protein [Prevotellaceae bacterium]|jgi:hypothetical protein|nr:C-GCAxxG-C-C family protein [Prevotellaceae bacterium]